METKVMKTQVAVVGAGAAGICAAIAAARKNKKVLLIEKLGCLGGITTTILDTMNGFYLPGKDNLKVVEGLPYEFVERLIERKQCFERANTYGSGTVITYDPETLKEIYRELLEESGVDVLLHTLVSDVCFENGEIKHLELTTKREKIHVEADVYIDCSGDGDVAYRCGYAFDGVGGKEHVQSLTTTFRVGNIDEEKAKTFTKQDMWNWMKEANQSGKYTLPREEGSLHKTTVKGCVQTNMVRVVLADPTDPFALTKAELDGHKQVMEYYNFMREYLPGYENSALLNTSIQIGVRETRRIIGEHVLHEDEILAGKKFEDGVVLCGSPIEDHNQTSKTKWVYLKENDAYLIPYRSLLPKDTKNLLVAGKCFSATHTAHAASRSIAQCMGMGQAAGVAAAIAIETQKTVKEIDITLLKQDLLHQKVQLEVGV